jgi:hypothetical protein
LYNDYVIQYGSYHYFKMLLSECPHYFSSNSAKSSFVPIVMGANAIHTTSLFVTQVPDGNERVPRGSIHGYIVSVY